MSSVVIKGNSSGSGSVTIEAPNTNSDYTVTLPASGGTLGEATPTAVSDQLNTSTGYFDLPSGTTEQRPDSPGAGMVRFNTTLGEPEWYDPMSSQWLKFSQGAGYNADIVTVGGGGGATGGTSSVNYGAGGAGGVLRSVNVVLARNDVYTVTIGSGGAGTAAGTPVAGGTSSVSGAGVSTSATGGGVVSSTSFSGANNADYVGGSGPGGTASGGGAGAGGNGSGSNGGTGALNSITGTATRYGGGGAGLNGGNPGTVDGGGGANANGTAGLGGGASGSSSGTSFNGGSGRVMISVLTSNYSGVTTGSPTVTTSGLYTILQFTSSGSYTA
jgi:hypothetical protein